MSEEYLPLVRLVAERIHRRLPPGVELESLIHAGVVGLLQAMERCNVQRGTLLPAYIGQRLQSEVLSYLRSLDWVNHAVRVWGRKVMTARMRLAERLNREATREEIAAELGISVEEYVRSNPQVGETMLLGLEELSLASDEEWLQAQQEFSANLFQDPLLFLRNPNIVDKLSAALCELSEQERLVISLTYYEEMTSREIGDILGLTEDCVWQICQQGVLRLRQMLPTDNSAIGRV